MVLFLRIYEAFFFFHQSAWILVYPFSDNERYVGRHSFSNKLCLPSFYTAYSFLHLPPAAKEDIIIFKILTVKKLFYNITAEFIIISVRLSSLIENTNFLNQNKQVHIKFY
jgi:hypothetical protein